MIIEIKGRVNQNGELTFGAPANLPPGEVDVVISYLTQAEEADEALWDAQFAATPDAKFDALIAQTLSDYQKGQTDKFDPNVEDD